MIDGLECHGATGCMNGAFSHLFEGSHVDSRTKWTENIEALTLPTAGF